VHADFALGCDGAHSPLRASLFASVGGSRQPRSSHHYACGGIASGVALPPAAATDQTELWGASGCFLIFRYTDSVTFWSAVLPGERPPRRQVRSDYQRQLLQTMREAFCNYHPVVSALIDATELESVGAYELRDVRLRAWAIGRVMLLGDAAHAMCNRLGSGGCTGMEDAAVAAEMVEMCLRAGTRGAGSDTLGRHAAVLEGFRLTERRRRHRAHRVQLESRLLAIFTVRLARSGVVRAVRDMLLRWVGNRSERWRLPVFDFLNNYRTSTDARLSRAAT
jgi:2-polyprenyl-6-methoxyphenol hydroxylase-like FAD-dependent oxidoreductase